MAEHNAPARVASASSPWLGRIANGLGRIANGLGRVAMGANAVGTLTVLVLVGVMNVDVVARNVFSAPFLGVIEVVIFSMVLIVFLQLPDVVRVNRLTRSDGLLVVLGTSHPRIAGILSRAVDGVAFVFMGIIAFATFPEFIDTFSSCYYITPPEFGPQPTGNIFADLGAATARCEYFGTPGVFTAPWWPARLAITASTALCSLLFLFKMLLGSRHPGAAGGARIS